MAFETTSTSSYASSCQQSMVAPKELLLVLSNLNEKRKEKQQKEQQHPNLLAQKQHYCKIMEEDEKVAELQFQPQSRQHMELSQIELIYRAEGNANLVLALPQFKKVLRLPKIQQKQEGKQQEQRQQQEQLKQGPQYRETQCSQKDSKQYRYAQQQEQQIQQDEKNQQIFTTGQQQNENAVGILTMDHYVAYISIIRCLVGNEFVFEADIVAVPNPNDRHWINEHIKPYRPASRLDKEFGGHFGLLLPDATQLPSEFDYLFSSVQHKAVTVSKTSDYSSSDVNIGGNYGNNNIFNSETFAIEIKPKQGWLLPNDVNNLFDIKPKVTTAETMPITTLISEPEITLKTTVDATTILNISTDTGCFNTASKNKPTQMDTQVIMTSRDDKKSHSLYDKVDTRCRYCCMQFLKVKQQKINQRSKYCPLDLFSGDKNKMFYALQSLFECPQNNLRIFKNGRLIFDDQLSRTSKIETLFSSDKLQLIKHLLITCLLKEYGNEKDKVYDERIQQQQQRQQQYMTTTAVDNVGGDEKTKVKGGNGSDGRPHSSAILCKKQKLNTITSTTTTTTGITETEVTKVKSTLTSAKPIVVIDTPALTSTSVSAYSTRCLKQINKAEVTCLPRNCVLEKILHLQLLAKTNLQFMLDHEYADKNEKTYNIVCKLLEKFTKTHNDLKFWQLSPEEQYVLGATALDCSIMITFCEIENVQNKEILIDNLYVVHLFGKTYLTQVTLLDLDPKPDTHFSKYCQQTKQIIEAMREEF